MQRGRRKLENLNNIPVKTVTASVEQTPTQSDALDLDPEPDTLVPPFQTFQTQWRTRWRQRATRCSRRKISTAQCKQPHFDTN